MTPLGVLFDWRGMLFHDLSHEDWVQASANSIGQMLTESDIRRIVGAG